MPDPPEDVVLPPEDRSSRHWIRERLALLDPERDYVEIRRLSGFAMSDFMVNWAFTLGMPRFNLGPSGTPLSRGRQGKLFADVDRRIDDVFTHGLTWAQFGPESPQTKRSMDIVNALHAKYQKIYPEEFSDLETWVYVIAFQVCGMPMIFSDYLGFPPPDEKEKISSAVFGNKLAEQFVYVDGRRLSEVMPPLPTYDDWVDFVRRYESRVFEYNQDATDCLNQVIHGYQKRSKLPAFFSRAVATSFWHDGMFRYTGIRPPGKFMKALARNYIRAVMLSSVLRRAIVGDPKESYWERLEREAAESRRPMNPVMKAVKAAPAASAGACPMGHGMLEPEDATASRAKSRSHG